MKAGIRCRKTSVTRFAVADTETYHIRCMARDGLDVRLVEEGKGKGTPRIWENGIDSPMYIWENGIDTAIVLHRFTGGNPTEQKPTTYIRQFGFAMGECQGDGVTREWGCKALEEFFEGIVNSFGSGTMRVYFHNLKFDIEMIWNAICEKAESRHDDKVFKVNDSLRIVAKNDCVKLVKGQCYKVEMKVECPKMLDGVRRGWKTLGKIEFRDSMKIWRKGADALAKDLGIVGKGATTGGSQALRTTNDELLEEYCIQDCRIIVSALQMYFKLVYEHGGPIDGYLTAGTTAIELGKIWLEDHLTQNKRFEGMTKGEALDLINTWFPSDIDAIDNYKVSVKDGKKVESIQNGVRQVECVYSPIVKTRVARDVDGRPVRDENGRVVKEKVTVHADGKSKYGRLFRDGYKGAIPLLNRKHTLKEGYVANDSRSLDINSAYPKVLCDYPMPIGNPIEKLNGADAQELFEKGMIPSGYQYYIAVDVNMHVKKGCRATFIDKTGVGECDDGNDGKLVDSFKGEIRVCQPEWEMICHDYNFYDTPKVKKVVLFKTMIGIFKGFIMQFYNMKSVSKGAKREFCKLIINSFYGKFGTNPFSEEECWVSENGIMKKRYVRGGTDIDCDFYLPYAIWTTAYVRQKISLGCFNIGWDNADYTDTDSIKISGLSLDECRERLAKAGTPYEPSYIIDDKLIGAFKDEGVHAKVVFIRNKGYVCLNDDYTISVDKRGNKEITMGGVNKFSGLECLQDLIDGKGHQNGHFSVIGGGLIMSKPIKLVDMTQFTEKVVYRIGDVKA